MKPRSKKSKPQGFFAQHRAKIIVGAVVLAGVIFFLTQSSSGSHARHDVASVALLAPPPPPPPPPPKPPPPEPKKMVQQTPVDKPEPKPDNAPKSTPIGPSAGKGSFKMGGSGGGGGGGGNGGSLWGWYAAAVQNTIKQALTDNPMTRHAAMGVTVRIWPDITGRITRVELVNSTGSTSLDEAIKDQVLNNLSLPEAPPQGMPMPINLRITARP